MNTKKLLGFAITIFLLNSCDSVKQAFVPDIEREELNILFGNPSNATTDVSNEDNYLITLPQYSLSYSRSRGLANWVSWHVNEDWLGNADRQDNFRPYDELPEGWYRVGPADYEFAINGFDRGHICPSADRSLTDVDNSATFFMINIFPQAPIHNQSLWVKLEEYCRKLVNEGNELYIISGNYGVGGTGNKGYREKLSGGKLTVPRHLWKVILVLPNGDDDMERIDEDTRIIAIDVENKNSLGEMPWSKFRVSVNEIEAATGYDLFSELPNVIEAVIEAKVDEVVIK
ncbi:MAG: DNA/RNA non-specific endonuclease [Saprospiraceae bacterium]|nr:DNA/RNA non-specific endonuclease [Saprospiraceae bacterium]